MKGLSGVNWYSLGQFGTVLRGNLEQSLKKWENKNKNLQILDVMPHLSCLGFKMSLCELVLMDSKVKIFF